MCYLMGVALIILKFSMHVASNKGEIILQDLTTEGFVCDACSLKSLLFVT